MFSALNFPCFLGFLDKRCEPFDNAAVVVINPWLEDAIADTWTLRCWLLHPWVTDM
jgi:hypothetical protein